MTLWSLHWKSEHYVRHCFITFHTDVCKELKQIQDYIYIYTVLVLSND